MTLIKILNGPKQVANFPVSLAVWCDRRSALGNPFELVTVLEFCKKYDLWLIEDNCDALGCTYTLPAEKAKELGLDHLIKIAEKGEHPIIRIQESGNGEQGTVTRWPASLSCQNGMSWA